MTSWLTVGFLKRIALCKVSCHLLPCPRAVHAAGPARPVSPPSRHVPGEGIAFRIQILSCVLMRSASVPSRTDRPWKWSLRDIRTDRSWKFLRSHLHLGRSLRWRMDVVYIMLNLKQHDFRTWRCCVWSCTVTVLGFKYFAWTWRGYQTYEKK